MPSRGGKVVRLRRRSLAAESRGRVMQGIANKFRHSDDRLDVGDDFLRSSSSPPNRTTSKPSPLLTARRTTRLTISTATATRKSSSPREENVYVAKLSRSSNPKTVITVTPTYARTFQALHLTGVMHSLMLVPYDVVWIVIEASEVTKETASIVSKSGLRIIQGV